MGNTKSKRSSKSKPTTSPSTKPIYNPSKKCHHSGCKYKRKYPQENQPPFQHCQFERSTTFDTLNLQDTTNAIAILHHFTPSFKSLQNPYFIKLIRNSSTLIPFLIAVAPNTALAHETTMFTSAPTYTFENYLFVCENGGANYFSDNLPSLKNEEQCIELYRSILAVPTLNLLTLKTIHEHSTFQKLPIQEIMHLLKIACHNSYNNYVYLEQIMNGKYYNYNEHRPLNSKYTPTTMLQTNNNKWVSQIDTVLNKDIYIAAISGTGPILIKKEFQDDYQVVKAAVLRHGHNLQHVSERYQNNQEICILACTKFGSSLEFAPKTMQNNAQVVSTAVKSFGQALRYANEKLKDDDDIALIAVLNSKGGALHECSKRLQKDRGKLQNCVFSLFQNTLKKKFIIFLTYVNIYFGTSFFTTLY